LTLPQEKFFEDTKSKLGYLKYNFLLQILNANYLGLPLIILPQSTVEMRVVAQNCEKNH